MRKLGCALFMLIAIVSGKMYASADENVFLAYEFSIWEQGGRWTPWEKVSLYVVIKSDSGNAKICIHSKDYQEYKIIDRIYENEKRTNGVETRWSAIDINGTRCNVLVNTNDEGDTLSIEYLDLVIAYKLKQY